MKILFQIFSIRSIVLLGTYLTIIYAESSDPVLETKIYAKDGQFPFHVGFASMNSDFTNASSCSGSLISNQHILTAAQCIIGKRSYAFLGVTNGSDFKSETYIIRKSSKVVIHPDYNADTHENDIAIITLDEPVEFTDAIQSIKLPDRSDEGKSYDGEIVSIASWGGVDNPNITTDELFYISNPVMSDEECNSPISNTICMQGENEATGCLGDPGSAVFTQDGNGHYLQLGIFSRVYPSVCSYSSPLIHTRISAYLDFIESSMENSEEKME